MIQSKLPQDFLWGETSQVYDEIVELQVERFLSNDQAEYNATLVVIAGQLFRMNQNLERIIRCFGERSSK